ncbi:MAG: D-alanyl-D-alanine carboxypeptidase [Phycicoccus sp.]|nr:D-alanyl-D-alanine carboxypeptidase [Phycicoccus sp.]NMM34863.1 D-alanyl-D-alanine carboxypeptidase [Phycicoccus sp.]
MIALRYAVSALALSLSLTAAGAFGMVGATMSAHAVGSVPMTVVRDAGDPVGTDPTGGAQLAEPGVIVNLGPGVPPPPAMPGASFVIADMDTGQILVARAPHTPRLPASTLKALTALTLIPRLDASATIIVKPEDVRVEGSRIGILAGTAYSVPTLFRGLLMASGNDAAYALARANQSAAVTLTEMNATAENLGAFDTVAKDPSGLDQPGQATSAYDLALIGRAAMKLPDFRGYVSTKTAAIPGGRSRDGTMMPGFKINNHNTLLYNYEGSIGVKNGYTIAARQTFIAAATRAGKTYIVTEMGSANGSWRPTAALLDWAFEHGTQVTPIGQLVEPGSVTRPGLTAASGAGPSEGATRQGSGSGVLDRPTVLRLPALQPWMGAAGLLSGMVLVSAFAARSIARRRS